MEQYIPFFFFFFFCIFIGSITCLLITPAGIHSLVLDASMNFAINAALAGRDRTRGTLEMKTETMRPARHGERYSVRGEVARLARQVAYGEAVVRDGAGTMISRATGTFLLHRDDPAPTAA